MPPSLRWRNGTDRRHFPPAFNTRFGRCRSAHIGSSRCEGCGPSPAPCWCVQLPGIIGSTHRRVSSLRNCVEDHAYRHEADVPVAISRARRRARRDRYASSSLPFAFRRRVNHRARRRTRAGHISAPIERVCVFMTDLAEEILLAPQPGQIRLWRPRRSQKCLQA